MLFVWKIIVSSNNNIPVLPCQYSPVKVKSKSRLVRKTTLFCSTCKAKNKKRDWFFSSKHCVKEKTASYIKNEPCVDTNSTCPGGTLSTVSQIFFNYTIIKQMIGKVRNFLVDGLKLASSRNQFYQIYQIYGQACLKT